MPRFDNTAPPDWCELRHYAIYRLALGEGNTVVRSAPRERLLMTEGRMQITAGGSSQVIRTGQFFDLPAPESQYDITATTGTAAAVALSGCWGDEIAGCGVWQMDNDPNATDTGDPVPYAKTTRMDSHYHDYDEYWVVLEGRATAVVSGEMFDVGPGDCLAIGHGHHHDLATVAQPFYAAFFETSLLGQRRLGHLWEHTHGPAVPDPAKS